MLEVEPVHSRATFPTLAALREFLDLDSPGFLFPCPGIPKPQPSSSRSPKLRQRHKRRVAVWRLACDFLHSLVALDSGLSVTKTSQRLTRPSSYGPNSLVLTAAQMRMHSLCLREATRLETARRTDISERGCELTGDQCTSLLLKIHADSRYGALRGSDVPQVSLQSDLLDEPPDDQVVRMLDVMSPEEAHFDAAEANCGHRKEINGPVRGS